MSSAPLRRAAAFIAVGAITLIVAAACGGSGSGGSSSTKFQQVTPATTVFTSDSLKAVGFKISKKYNVEGLTDAQEALHGFWGLDPYKRSEYEVRIYPSHEIAISSGTALAVESTGAEFEASRRSPTWKEGVKDRWRARGTTDVSSPLSQQAPGPTYPQYAIYGNLILLCEGLSDEQSFDNCEALEEALAGGGA